MPFFSVIIPVFNRSSLIAATIQSVLSQEFQDFEIIVVDDGSTDALESALAAFAGKVTLLRQDNRGPGTARNLGVSVAQGQYLAFLDSDDLWFPWTLSVYKSVIDKENMPPIILGNPYSFQSESEVASFKQDSLSIIRFRDYFDTHSSVIFRGSGSMVVATRAFREVGGFPEGRFYCEDMDLLFRLGAQRGCVSIKSPHLLAYRQHAGSSVGGSERTYHGMLHILKQESLNKYPGGSARKAERMKLICDHARFVSYVCSASGRRRAAAVMYLRTFWWHFRLHYIFYLISFPYTLVTARMNPHLAWFKSRKPQSMTASDEASSGATLLS